MDRDDEKTRAALRRVASLLEAVAKLIEAAVDDGDEAPVVHVEPMDSQPTQAHPCDAPTRKVPVSAELLASMVRGRSASGIVEVDPAKRDGVPLPVPSPKGS